ncbi:50S ribosome-binding GTPase [Candidatus Woesebacteria bacterium]|nr:50S ribosome-binding GTPase [Candidatus Woesebacteria bacterium]QQG47218.1 MAG: 50S ribosome-binding GTPase [Candidatus Woesebacteria bacterium]
MGDIQEQIKDIEDVLAKTPHHKATDHFIGRMRARIARLKDQQIETTLKKGGGGGGGYAVKKHGDATIVLVGPPSVGKSTLINNLTNAQSKVAEYSFTTVSVIPGMLEYKGARFQILDVPGLIEGAKEGKGKGREVLSIVRNADLIILMTDIYKVDIIKILERELYEAGLRINKEKPDVKVDKKIDGGLHVFSNIKQEFDKETIKEVAREIGIKNADITIKEKLSLERLIDAFNKNRIYIPALYVINKADLARRSLKGRTNYLYISANKNTGIEILKEKIWEALNFATVYLVEPNEEPSFNHPIITKKGVTLKQLAEKIGTNFAEGKKKAKIWGTGAKFASQEVSLKTQIQDGMQVRFV